MTKTEKNLNHYVENTIKTFKSTLEYAKENGWTLDRLIGSLDNDEALCYGALIFTNIYESKLDGTKFVALRNELHDAKWSTINEFMSR